MRRRELWYVACRLDGHTTMRIFKTKRRALKAAWQMLGDDPRRDVEVGPMVEGREGVLRGDELRRTTGRS